MAVLDLESAKDHLNITSGEHDVKLTAMITAAEAAIGERVGPLEPESRTVRVAPLGRALSVPSPAASLGMVTDAYGATVDVFTLHLQERTGLITRSDGGTFGGRWYDVVYDYGRATCPPDLVLAVKEMVRHLWDTQRGPSRRPGSTASDTTANTIPGAAYLLPFRVSELIAPHRPQLVC